MRLRYLVGASLVVAGIVVFLLLPGETEDSADLGAPSEALPQGPAGLTAGGRRGPEHTAEVRGILHVVTERDGKPLANSQVRVTPVGGTLRVIVEARGEGRWSLGAAREADLEVHVTAKGYDGVTAPWRLVDGARLRIPMSRLAEARIVVQDASGDPVDDARCLMRPSHGRSGGGGTWTNRRGIATVRGVQEGVPHRLVVKHPEFVRHESDVTPRRGAQTVVTLRRGAALVVSGLSGRGLPDGAVLQVTASQGGIPHLLHVPVGAASDGRATCIGRVPYGPVTLRAELAGCVLHDAHHMIGGDEHLLDLRDPLSHYVPVTVSVVDEMGKPVDEARCRVHRGASTVSYGGGHDDGLVVVLVPRALQAWLMVEAPGFESATVSTDEGVHDGELLVELRRTPVAVLVVAVSRSDAAAYRLGLRALVGRDKQGIELKGTAGKTEHAIAPGTYEFRLAYGEGTEIRGRVHAAPGERVRLRPEDFDAGFMCKLVAAGGHLPVRGMLGPPFDPQSPPFLLTTSNPAVNLRVYGDEVPVHVFSASGLVLVGRVSAASPALEVVGPPRPRDEAVITVHAGSGIGELTVEHGAPRSVRSRVHLDESGVGIVRLRLERPRRWIVAAQGVEVELPLVPGDRRSVTLAVQPGGTMDLRATHVVALYRQGSDAIVRKTLEREHSGLWRLPRSSSEILIAARHADTGTHLVGRLPNSDSTKVLSPRPVGERSITDAHGVPLTGRMSLTLLGEHRGVLPRMQLLAALGSVREGIAFQDVRAFGDPAYRLALRTSDAVYTAVGNLSAAQSGAPWKLELDVEGE